MFMVPCVSICNRSTICNSCDLISIIPPCHDTRIFGCVVPQPPVCLAVIINNDYFTILLLTLQDDRGIVQTLRHPPAIVFEGNETNEEKNSNKQSDSAADDQAFLGFVGFVKRNKDTAKTTTTAAALCRGYRCLFGFFLFSALRHCFPFIGDGRVFFFLYFWLFSSKTKLAQTPDRNPTQRNTAQNACNRSSQKNQSYHLVTEKVCSCAINEQKTGSITKVLHNKNHSDWRS
mmetsp:Transcript_18892/g.25992  ORF Transcript_18892/g.25992 Transcript_18892/m.25992 type:complete len:232 (+) Transcript_18892:1097-1792(+)